MTVHATCDCGITSNPFTCRGLTEMRDAVRRQGWRVDIDWPSGEKPRAYKLFCPSGHGEPTCRLEAVATVATAGVRGRLARGKRCVSWD